MCKLDQDLNITQLENAPIDLGVNTGTIVSVDSVSGKYLAFGSGAVWEFSIDTDTWIELTNLGGDIPGFDMTVVVPISTHGVNMFLTSTRGVYLYKHATSEPDEVSPSAPTNLELLTL